VKLVDQILADAFEAAQRDHPQAMAPFVARLADPVPTHEREAIMQTALRTIEGAEAPDIYEQCARIAETIDVPCNGHIQIDAPTVGDAQRAIAAAIRALRPAAPARPDPPGGAETAHLKSHGTESQSRDCLTSPTERTTPCV
jgi:hypothetical protein